jgi:hypothetical protein
MKGVYKHVCNTDVAMQVLKSYWIEEKQAWKVKVIWLNITNPKKPFVIDFNPESHYIPKDKVKNWKVYDVENL